MGSAGLYLEDYFEEQLKQIYPDKIFPGGMEEQMIPPLEDEIDEDEEEMMDEGVTPLEDQKPQSPVGNGIPPVEEDLPAEETTTVAEETKLQTEKAIDATSKDTDKKVKFEDEHRPPDVEVQLAKTPEQEQSSVAADSETKDRESPGSHEGKNPLLPTEKTADPPEAQKESAPAGTCKEEG